MLISPEVFWPVGSARAANALRIGGPGTGLKRIRGPDGSWGLFSGGRALSAIVPENAFRRTAGIRLPGGEEGRGLWEPPGAAPVGELGG